MVVLSAYWLFWAVAYLFTAFLPQRSLFLSFNGNAFFCSNLKMCFAFFSLYLVVKTRLQTLSHLKGEIQFNGILDCFYRTFKQEGVRALFKGAGCRVMVMAPLFGIAQTVYYLGVAEFLLGLGNSKLH